MSNQKLDKVGSHQLAKNDIHQSVQIMAGDVELSGDLNIPAGAKGLVIFAHGSGSSRHSPRNKFVANLLNVHHSGTLLIDLLSAEEEAADQISRRLRFDIDMLVNRLVRIVEWVQQQPWAIDIKLGYFGSSTGGGAALIAAAKQPDGIAAVVSRGGRPDLAGEYLPVVTAPTLLLVGEHDLQVLGLNEEARDKLTARCELKIIPKATHLFEEPGTLEQVAHAAADWFTECFESEG